MYSSFDKEKPPLLIFELPTIDKIDNIGLGRRLIDYRSNFYPFVVMMYGYGS